MSRPNPKLIRYKDQVLSVRPDDGRVRRDPSAMVQPQNREQPNPVIKQERDGVSKPKNPTEVAPIALAIDVVPISQSTLERETELFQEQIHRLEEKPSLLKSRHFLLVGVVVGGAILAGGMNMWSRTLLVSANEFAAPCAALLNEPMSQRTSHQPTLLHRNK